MQEKHVALQCLLIKYGSFISIKILFGLFFAITATDVSVLWSNSLGFRFLFPFKAYVLFVRIFNFI